MTTLGLTFEALSALNAVRLESAIVLILAPQSSAS